MNDLNQPLVSVIVVAYNSSKYVLETLESAKAQTYENIELIVTDDCSTDDTVEICRKWIEDNKKRFVRTELITAVENTGVAPNCNRGVKVAHAEWIKLIDGDDIMLKECINYGVAFIKEHKDTQIFASNVKKFYNDHSVDTFQITQLQNLSLFDPGITSQNQFKIILRQNPIISPSVFFHKRVFDLNNGFDEAIPFLEDYPFWIKTLQNGVKIDFLPEITVGYRYREDSLSGHNKLKIFNGYYREHLEFQRKYTFKYMSCRHMFNQVYIYIVKYIFDVMNLNKSKYSKLYLFFLRLNVLNWESKTFKKLFSIITARLLSRDTGNKLNVWLGVILLVN